MWPEYKVVFPDYFNADIWSIWAKWILEFRRAQLAFDAVWLVRKNHAERVTVEVILRSVAGHERAGQLRHERLPSVELAARCRQLDAQVQRHRVGRPSVPHEFVSARKLLHTVFISRDIALNAEAAYLYDNQAEMRTERLSMKTLCMEGIHNDKYRHYDVHSIYGIVQSSKSVQ